MLAEEGDVLALEDAPVRLEVGDGDRHALEPALAGADDDLEGLGLIAGGLDLRLGRAPGRVLGADAGEGVDDPDGHRGGGGEEEGEGQSCQSGADHAANDTSGRGGEKDIPSPWTSGGPLAILGARILTPDTG